MSEIGLVTLVVADYDEAIDFYRDKLGFVLREDMDMGNGKRWVVLAPRVAVGCGLLLGKAGNQTQRAAIGNQTGGRVGMFLHSENFRRDYHFMKERGVVFLEEPREEEYATVVVFEDLYGNRWDLLQPKV